jgi:hypothetical protein
MSEPNQVVDPAPAIPRQALKQCVEPLAPEVAMPNAEEEDEVEDYSDMEGVQREGLFDSQHAPLAGKPNYITQYEAEKRRGGKPSKGVKRKKKMREEKNSARKEEKGKGKEIIRGPGTGANAEPKAPRTILKRPEAERWEMM